MALGVLGDVGITAGLVLTLGIVVHHSVEFSCNVIPAHAGTVCIRAAASHVLLGGHGASFTARTLLLITLALRAVLGRTVTGFFVGLLLHVLLESFRKFAILVAGLHHVSLVGVGANDSNEAGP